MAVPADEYTDKLLQKDDGVNRYIHTEIDTETDRRRNRLMDR